MSAWHKALKSMRSVEGIRRLVTCCHKSGVLVNGQISNRAILNLPGDCKGMDFSSGWTTKQRPTKLEVAKHLKGVGWTWDSDGNWLCPYCSKEGE